MGEADVGVGGGLGGAAAVEWRRRLRVGCGVREAHVGVGGGLRGAAAVEWMRRQWLRNTGGWKEAAVATAGAEAAVVAAVLARAVGGGGSSLSGRQHRRWVWWRDRWRGRWEERLAQMLWVFSMWTIRRPASFSKGSFSA